MNNDYMSKKLSKEELDQRVQENITKWQDIENPLAPLSDEAKDILYRIRDFVASRNVIKEEEIATPKEDVVDNLRTFVERFNQAESEMLEEFLHKYRVHEDYLTFQAKEAQNLYNDADKIVVDMDDLKQMYGQVTSKTGTLHTLSEQLIKHQRDLKEKKEKIAEKLSHFTSFNGLHESLVSQSHNYNSPEFIAMLERINTSLNYMIENSHFKEAGIYKLRYETLLARCLQQVTRHVGVVITDATNQVLGSEAKTVDSQSPTPEGPNSAFSYYYGKFQAAAAKINRIVAHIEENCEGNDMYTRTLIEFQRSYFSQRAPVLQAAVSKALADLRGQHRSDHSVLFRSAALFTIKVCQDETTCYHYFFGKSSTQLHEYLSGLCQNLYDTLRPSLISINHIEILSELCTILRDMLNDQIQNNPALDQFVEITRQLLEDVEERLVFRINIFLQYDLSKYVPSPGDLAYPEKLEQMENIAEELIERRADSRTSSISLESQEVASITSGAGGGGGSVSGTHYRSYTGNSPADLHGMWYPTVKRTLVCLSRLYVCLDKEIFQGVAQEALIVCVDTVERAADLISERKTTLDGKLFQIKHLLIVREQIAPFQVDFTVKETSLDFSGVRNAALGLVHHRRRIFSMSSSNALLEFLLEGTPKVREYLVDSRKEIDKRLKIACECFIQHATNLLIGNLLQWLQKAEQAQKVCETYKDNVTVLREQDSFKSQILAGIISFAQRNIKTKIPDVQRAMRLYLANRETEFILFRPIKNNIINAFIQVEQLLISAKYTADDQLLVACPTADQLNVLISSVSLSAEQEHHQLARSLSKLKTDKS